jgi:hypothetical protein
MIWWGSQAPLERTLQLTLAFRLIVNMFMIRGVGGSEMEWAYAWDLHFNGFFVFFSWIYVLQPFLLPLITAQKWISLLLGNTLYFVAWVVPCLVNLRLTSPSFMQYIYVVYLGLTGEPNYYFYAPLISSPSSAVPQKDEPFSPAFSSHPFYRVYNLSVWVQHSCSRPRNIFWLTFQT